ncbi:ERF family protein [Pediococcus acidilactici]|uniref:ERF family protein n=1 Tax=Pediococcus acidilactici TaxID=1254 RepID=UPI002AFEB261|nr:ERF family protein [Pediococcus acidilactici]WQS10538.1 ERF family protein [Pediococcus acidilactici]
MTTTKAEPKEEVKPKTSAKNSKPKTLYQKLQTIHVSAKYVQKSQRSTQYSYAGSSDVLGQIHELMDQEGVLLIPRITGKNVMTSSNKKGAVVYFTELIMTMTWVNSDNPDEKIECPWYAQGVDTAGEKGVGKALTYGEKYFLLKFFNIATDDMDPDSFQKNVESKKQPDPVSNEQSETLTALFKAMATATGKPETVVESAYLSKVNVARISDLNYETANQMIVLVTKQLDHVNKTQEVQPK